MHAVQARTLARYNRWMNGKFYALCSQLTDAQRKQDRKAFFKSIHGTLNHLLLADRLWLGRFQAKPYPVKGLDEELFADFEVLGEERKITDTQIEAWAADLSDEILAGELHYTSVVNPAPRSIALWLAVTHFFNHQTHHRGQLSTLLAQCGLDCGVTDLLWMPDSL